MCECGDYTAECYTATWRIARKDHQRPRQRAALPRWALRRSRQNKGREPAWRLAHCKHSPTGLEWGYNGSGCAQLAFAILFDHFKHTDRGGLGTQDAKTIADRAYALHQPFKFRVVAKLPRQEWRLTSEQVAEAVAALRPFREKP